MRELRIFRLSAARGGRTMPAWISFVTHPMNRNQIFVAHDGFARLELIAARAYASLRALFDLVVKLRRAWAVARVRRELHDLSDRTLKDIGLSRAQIDALFR